MKPMTVWSLHYFHRHGDDITVHPTKEAAEAALLDIVHQWWADEVGAEPIPEDPTAARRRYFEAAEDESAEIEAHTLEGATAPANARLLAASYTAFDRAGRELGADAAELAERIDLVGLIQAARDALAYIDHQPNATRGSLAEVAQCGVRYQLRTALAKVQSIPPCPAP